MLYRVHLDRDAGNGEFQFTTLNAGRFWDLLERSRSDQDFPGAPDVFANFAGTVYRIAG